MELIFAHGKTLTNNELLRERMELCFARYKLSVMQLGSEAIFNKADQIKHITDIYSIFSFPNTWLNEADAGFLLRFENPLLLLANEWRNHSMIFGTCFLDFLEAIKSKDESEHGVEIEIITELIEMHSVDTPIFEGALIELVELGKRIFPQTDYQESNNYTKGAGFCSEV